ncbi:MAG: hypothetical protein AB1705_06235 [Verrucomicrobiota bacterium]
MNLKPIDLSKLRVYPLETRRSLTSVEDILVDPESSPPPCSELESQRIQRCAQDILNARAKNASVILIYGAHLLRNGAARILARMMERGWLTHLATNGAGTIHDWEYAWHGHSTESVQDNVAIGQFGTWEETGRNIHLALLSGGVRGEGYGQALGKFIWEEGTLFPTPEAVEKALLAEPNHPLAAARADLLHAMRTHNIPAGRYELRHKWRYASIVGQAFGNNVPLTVHPGIGYDIIANHPMFNGAVIGRAADIDFRLFCSSVERLDDGVVMSVGSAIMGPQVFEKSLSCVNNLRLQEKRSIVRNHSIYVVDLQDGGNWDWTRGEPPKDNPAYYLRFCKSFSRMHGIMRYLQCDNLKFIHNLLHELRHLSIP